MRSLFLHSLALVSHSHSTPTLYLVFADADLNPSRMRIKNPENGLGEETDAIRGDADLSEGGLSAVAAYLRSWVSPSD